MRGFTQVDVFTDELALGNAVAVVHDAEGLDDGALQAFARWTQLSETTFLFPPTEPSADYRLRIFTTARELPFAGHPTLGSARAWLEAGGVPKRPDVVVQQCGAGLVPIRRSGERLAFQAPPLVRSGPVDESGIAELARGLGIERAEILDAAWVDNGPGWVAVRLASAEGVLDLQPDATRFSTFHDVGAVGPHRQGGDAAFEVRAFIIDDGVTEDPVTGSLNASVAAWLMDTGAAPSSYVASQGGRLGRRGRVHVERVDGAIWVGGDTVVGVRGMVAL